MTVRQALDEGTAVLQAAGCPTPRVDAEWLLAHVLETTRTGLATAARELEPAELTSFRALLARRAEREPLAYVLGEWGFRRLLLRVDGRALIPRPETESLVERCLSVLDGIESPTVLDVGVGSGAIALALADERPDLRVVGTEVADAALALAEENKWRVGLDGRVRFVRGSGIAGERGPFDLVVSNPPYVAPGELDSLEAELRYEPRGALVGEKRHEEIAGAAFAVIRPGGRLVFEVGDGQAGAVAATLRALGYDDVTISPDLTGRERVVDALRP